MSLKLKKNEWPYQPQEGQWVGYGAEPIKLQRQSKYSPDVLSLPTVVAEQDEADYHYSKYDMDEPERY